MPDRPLGLLSYPLSRYYRSRTTGYISGSRLPVRLRTTTDRRVLRGVALGQLPDRGGLARRGPRPLPGVGPLSGRSFALSYSYAPDFTKTRTGGSRPRTTPERSPPTSPSTSQYIRSRRGRSSHPPCSGRTRPATSRTSTTSAVSTRCAVSTSANRSKHHRLRELRVPLPLIDVLQPRSALSGTSGTGLPGRRRSRPEDERSVRIRRSGADRRRGGIRRASGVPARSRFPLDFARLWDFKNTLWLQYVVLHRGPF